MIVMMGSGDIVKTIRSEIRSVLGEFFKQEDTWLNEEQLLQEFGMFTHSWLKRYAKALPPGCRTRIGVEDESGEIHYSQWAYSKRTISELIATNRIKNLKL